MSNENSNKKSYLKKEAFKSSSSILKLTKSNNMEKFSMDAIEDIEEEAKSGGGNTSQRSIDSSSNSLISAVSVLSKAKTKSRVGNQSDIDTAPALSENKMKRFNSYKNFKSVTIVSPTQSERMPPKAAAKRVFKIPEIPSAMVYEFLQNVAKKRWNKAAQLCREIIILQPDNRSYREYMVLLQSLIIADKMKPNKSSSDEEANNTSGNDTAGTGNETTTNTSSNDDEESESTTDTTSSSEEKSENERSSSKQKQKTVNKKPLQAKVNVKKTLPAKSKSVVNSKKQTTPGTKKQQVNYKTLNLTEKKSTPLKPAPLKPQAEDDEQKKNSSRSEDDEDDEEQVKTVIEDESAEEEEHIQIVDDDDSETEKAEEPEENDSDDVDD